MISRSILAVACVFSLTAAAHETSIPHFDLEMTSQEYQAVLAGHDARHSGLFSATDDGLQAIIALGKRNMDWLAKINEGRTPAISFSSAATQQGFPLDSPRIYNEQIVLDKASALQAALPEAMSAMLYSDAPLTSDLPLALEDYKHWGLEVDRVYQIAARWIMMEEYLPQLEARTSGDIRGYYFLKKDEGRDSALSHFSSLPAARQAQYQDWLTGLCHNSGNTSSECQAELQNALSSQALPQFYAKYLPAGQARWQAYYEIPGGTENSGFLWAGQNISHMPFQNAPTAEQQDFLKKNIEDEWHWQDWHLLLDFGMASGVDVVWQPGIVPHVPFLGASQIYMDAVAPRSEYNTQWTIRHEFGHTLGFPDCYYEGYDSSKGVIVSYQLDTTDLMCSRQGHLKARHLAELRRAYHSPLLLNFR